MAVAQSASSNYAQQLADMGYQGITISTTWLGRTVIRATLDGVTRELVIAKNGQILFDYKDVDQKMADAETDDSDSGDRQRVARGVVTDPVTVPIMKSKSVKFETRL